MENINLIRKLAWSFHHSTGLDWDDLFQEAALAYLEGMNTYDPDKGALSTHMWHVITSRLKNYVKQERNWKNPLCDLEEANGKGLNYTTFWDYIPDEIKEEVSLILRSPEIFNTIILNYELNDKKNELTREDQLKERITAKKAIRTLLFQEGRTLQEVRMVVSTLKHVFA